MRNKNETPQRKMKPVFKNSQRAIEIKKRHRKQRFVCDKDAQHSLNLYMSYMNVFTNFTALNSYMGDNEEEIRSL